jgi:glutathione S-transferase
VQRIRFGVRTVPAVRLETGEKLSGSRNILRRLEELAPQPSLFPADPEARQEVERAEEWGDQVWQPIGRRLLWQALVQKPGAMSSYRDGSSVRVPTPVVRVLAPVLTGIGGKLNAASELAVRADLRALPGHLDRIDGWLERGVLSAGEPNAADLQIATSSRMIMTFDDVRPAFAGRPAEQHALRHFPHWDGSTPAGAFPSEWGSS